MLLLSFLYGLTAEAQNQNDNTEKREERQSSALVKGVVLDERGEPLPRVAVYDPKSVSTGTMTSEDGAFAITVSASCKLLCFEYLGYKKKELPLRDVAIVRLEPDLESIEATVVTGIYTRKAESFTGAVQSFSSEDLKRVSNANVFESLKNIDPSLMIFDNLEQGSNPNAMVSMQLRGASSFGMETTSLKSNFVNDPNMPLFILDGFETTVEKIQDLDMNRVESITILKDASAKAIYGSKAGNGVIVVETKQLRSDQTLVTYTGSISLEMPDLTSYNLCNSLEKLEVERRENYYSETLGGFSTENYLRAMELYYKRLKRAMEGEDTYWLSKPLRTGVGQKHSLSVELGNKDLKTMASFSYSDDQGAMKGSYRRILAGDINTSYRRKEWQFRNIMSISAMNSEDSPYGTFDEYAVLNPYNSPYDAEGNVRKTFYDSADGIEVVRGNITNPLYDATIGTRHASDYLDFADNLYVEYNVIEPLKLVGRLGIDTKRTYSEDFLPGDHTRFVHYGVGNSATSLTKGSYEASNGRMTSLSADVSAQFNHNVAHAHDIFATAQYSVSQTTYSEVSHYTRGFPSSRMNDITFARQYAEGMVPTGSTGLNRNLGVLLTAGYGYKDRYMVDATVKGSASSVFGTDNKWGVFWSAGFAWNAHKEAFLRGNELIKQLKLRFSLGSSGNQNYTTNNALPVYQYFNDAYYNGFAGAYVQNMENPKLGWEQKMDYNLGLDFRLQNLTVVLDAYVADTKNLVFLRSILPSTGFSTVSDNLGKVRNKGIEASVNYRLYQQGSSYFAVFGKIAMNDNKLLEVSDVLRNYNKIRQEQAAENNQVEPVVQYYEGVPLHSIWVVRSLGVNPVDGKEIFLDRNGDMTSTWNAADLVNLGSSDPLFNGNFGINGEIKGFGISMVCTYYGGGYKYNTTLLNKVENADIGNNIDRRIFSGRWYEPGLSAQYRNGYTSNTKATSRFVQKNNVLSLSSASFYYEFPYRLISKAKLSRLRATLYLNDLYTFSSIEIERGTSYPYARTFSFSLTATF